MGYFSCLTSYFGDGAVLGTRIVKVYQNGFYVPCSAKPVDTCELDVSVTSYTGIAAFVPSVLPATSSRTYLTHVLGLDLDNKVLDLYFGLRECSQVLQEYTVGYPNYDLRRCQMRSSSFGYFKGEYRKGINWHYPNSFFIGSPSQTYQFALLPGIELVNPSGGTRQGQLLTIDGYPFSTVKGETVVTVENLNCEIRSISKTQIQCLLEPGTVSSAGSKHYRYGVWRMIWNSHNGLYSTTRPHTLLISKEYIYTSEMVPEDR